MNETKVVKCKLEAHKMIQFYKHRKGFTFYSLISGNNLVLSIQVESSVEGTSIKLLRELAVEIRNSPPINQELDAEEWIAQALYRFGSSNVQFESQTFSGSIKIAELLENGDCHGNVNLTFTNPEIDKGGFGKADISIPF